MPHTANRSPHRSQLQQDTKNPMISIFKACKHVVGEPVTGPYYVPTSDVYCIVCHTCTQGFKRAGAGILEKPLHPFSSLQRSGVM